MNRHVKPQTMTWREFHQHRRRAKAAADQGPLLITDRSGTRYVLMTEAAFDRLAEEPAPTEQKKRPANMVEALHQVGGPEKDYEIELPKRYIGDGRSLAAVIADTRPEADVDYDFPRLTSHERPVDFGEK